LFPSRILLLFLNFLVIRLPYSQLDLYNMTAVAPYLCSLAGIDDDSVALILELQLEDVDTLQAQVSGKQREGTQTDAEFALLLTWQELERLRSNLSDRRMTRSIANAVEQDGPLVAATAFEEEAARRDHVLAQRLNGGRAMPEAPEHEETLDDQLLSKLAGMYLSEDSGVALFNDCEEEETGGSSSVRGGHRADRRNVNRRCVACQETKKFFDVISGPCNHEYCRDCLRELFEASLTDDSLFPPRCCRRPIPVQSVGIFLTKDIKQRLEEKRVEFSTPNRTYCCNARCSAFIKAGDIEGDTATCSSCGSTTCTVCMSSSHIGECSHDTALHAVVDLANKENWQRCYSCRSIVQLEVGCNHIMQGSPTCAAGLLADFSQMSMRSSVLLCVRSPVEDLRL
jgi:hypothetical protein